MIISSVSHDLVLADWPVCCYWFKLKYVRVTDVVDLVFEVGFAPLEGWLLVVCWRAHSDEVEVLRERRCCQLKNNIYSYKSKK